jgi:CheY-like chemotaxis protein
MVDGRSLTGLTVLVLEDDQDNLDMLATFLDYCGAAVVASRSADIGLQCVTEQRFDAIVTDITVLRMGADVFLRQVRAAPGYEATPVIVVSGWMKEHVSQRDPGFTEYLLKPADLDTVAATILRLARPATATSA